MKTYKSIDGKVILTSNGRFDTDVILAPRDAERLSYNEKKEGKIWFKSNNLFTNATI